MFKNLVLQMAVQVGLSSSDASFLISVVGISNTLGRLVSGWLADLKWTSSLGITIITTIIGIRMPNSYIGCDIILIFFVSMGCQNEIFKQVWPNWIKHEAANMSFLSPPESRKIQYEVNGKICSGIQSLSNIWTICFSICILFNSPLGKQLWLPSCPIIRVWLHH